MIKLLLVEDDASLRYIVQGGLEDMIGGYEVIVAANGEEGLKQWKEQHPDVTISYFLNSSMKIPQKNRRMDLLLKKRI